MKQAVIHLWDVQEITLRAAQPYDNPYTDVTVWVDLKGPGFEKRCYGFWDGGNVFKVRVTATAPGSWTYVSGANVDDAGLVGKIGGYLAIEWTEAEKQENPCRRGIIKASENGHAFEYADGTPYIMVGDTWWALASYRYPWVDDENERPIGPGMSVKDMVRHRRKQGYNAVGMIAGFPTWANDGKPSAIKMDDEHDTYVRGAWAIGSVDDWIRRKPLPARDMHNEGGRPFEFPGKIAGYEDVVPDYDRINPEYFKALDKKMDWLNDNGITVFIEALRRDCSKTFKYYYDWPMVYTRYIQYLFARYQANNILYSPIHFDGKLQTIDAREFNEPINLFIDIYGHPPFGTLLGTNAPGSTKSAYGGPEEQHWKTFDQTGNWRDHQYHWLLTDIFHDENPLPAINGEPYYSGHITIISDEEDNLSEILFGNVDSEEDLLNCRSSYFGSVLSGAYGGLLAGFEAMWSGNVEEAEEPYKIWDSMTFPATYQVRYVSDFLLSEGRRYMELIPDSELILPNKTGKTAGWRGWASCSATKKRDLIMGYVEKDCPRIKIRGVRPYDIYELSWFNPRTGQWLEEKVEVEATHMGNIPMPAYPDEFDWAFKLKKLNNDFRINNESELAVERRPDTKYTYIQTDSKK